jgi:hypothetical protein
MVISAAWMPMCSRPQSGLKHSKLGGKPGLR